MSGANSYFESNNNNAYNTDYGEKFVVMYYPDSGSDSLSQGVSGLDGGDFTLSYAFAISAEYFYYTTGEAICTFTASYAGQQIDSLSVDFAQAFDYGSFSTRTQTFTPAQANGNLLFEWECTYLDGFMDLLLDNISLEASG